MASPMVTAEVIEVEEFPDLGRKYLVSSIPKTVINDKIEFVGAAPEQFVIEKLLSLNNPS